MKVLKKLIIVIIPILLIAGYSTFKNINSNWPKKFSHEFDIFFGKGNWESVSEETKESIIYDEYIIVHSAPYLSENVPGKFKEWNITYMNSDNKREMAIISDHTFKINNDKYFIFSKKRYSAKQALTLEFMNISFSICGDKVMKESISPYLSEKEMEALTVDISYNGGNPKPEFYDDLIKEDWFNVKDVSANDYLNYDKHEFYIYIRSYDYKLNKLTDEEKQHLFDSMEKIEKDLLKKYGKNASFEIYIDENHKVEYKDGVKIAN
ncbi:hypothetical protein [Anaerofustis sp. NSJ-163]|uniref:hypothetical protein n=1 Tax=Anaerofustis sp. NSJ-163 TaxID=2944391 RepID=UPI00209BFD6C|nr:hypothetical protein [Anaerofustis sp. NSJ-163]MCO8193673.1 hypothetical protein [Anaerofustis sp. NSJ-163]